MHIESLSNGLGSQSMYMMLLAADGIIPSTVSITADTGSEDDRLWNTGERTTAREYYEQVVIPLGKRYGIETRFVRAVDRFRRDMSSLAEHTRTVARAGRLTCIKMPVFGSNGGRLGQSCTSRWKIAAINQELRRLGATTARTAQGIHYGEAARRVKGKYIGNVGGFETYATTIKRDGEERVVKWLSHYYPLVDQRLRRQEVQCHLEARGIPYLVSSECDMCPHQDPPRWLRHTPESLARSAEIEASFGGEYFLTNRLVPLLTAIEQMREEEARRGDQFTLDVDFGCGNSYCGV